MLSQVKIKSVIGDSGTSATARLYRVVTKQRKWLYLLSILFTVAKATRVTSCGGVFLF